MLIVLVILSNSLAVTATGLEVLGWGEHQSRDC